MKPRELRSKQVRYQLSHLSQENVIVYFPGRINFYIKSRNIHKKNRCHRWGSLLRKIHGNGKEVRYGRGLNIFILCYGSIPLLGIGIESGAAGISIPAFIISVRYWNILVPGWVSLFLYETSSVIGDSFHSGTYQIDRMPDIPVIRHSKLFTMGDNSVRLQCI